MALGYSTVQAITITGQSPSTQMTEGEVQGYTYDAINDLGPGQTLVNPGVALVDARDGTPVEDGATLGEPPVTGNVIAIRVEGVARDHLYELRISFDHTPPRVAGEHSVKLHLIQGF